MDGQNFSAIQRACDGNICINRSEMAEFIIVDQILYVELCGECQELTQSILQIQSLTHVTQLRLYPSPFIKWKNITQIKFNGFTVIRLLRKVLKISNIIRDFISSIWYGFDMLEAGIDNVISNIRLVESLNIKYSIKA